jgi:glycosyltransferase involved in cell wall biosynthesis
VTRFSAGLYKIIFSYATDRLRATAPNGAKLLERVAERFLAGENPAHLSFSERVGHVVEAVRTGKAFDLLKPNDLSLNRELTLYFLDGKVKDEIDAIIRSEPSPERRSFRVSSKIANDLIYRLFHQILGQVQRHNYLEALQPASGLIPVAGSVGPYVFSYFNMYGHRRLWSETARRFNITLPPELKNEKRAWFTDTLEDVNGVARTIRTMGAAAQKSGRDLTIVTCKGDSKVEGVPLKNFTPVGEFELPEYKLQKLSFPPILDMIDYIERERFTECIISTPGPVGLTALAAAKLMGLRTSGIYHTDFPQYVRILTEDEGMETMMWNFMHWFYSQLDLIYVNSVYYKECWIDRGIPPEKLKILPRGLDTDLFNHTRRQNDFWKKRGATSPVLIYVGRVSKEKELEFLCDVMEELSRRGIAADLAVVGDGPYRDDMAKRLPNAIFTGVLNGEELAQAYASADLFVFPSTTDTFGNVVIEAISSAIPAFVSDVGGPCELVEDGKNGKILAANQLAPWADAITQWLESPQTPEQRDTMARETQAKWSWTRAFDRFWEEGLE